MKKLYCAFPIVVYCAKVISFIGTKVTFFVPHYTFGCKGIIEGIYSTNILFENRCYYDIKVLNHCKIRNTKGNYIDSINRNIHVFCEFVHE